MNMNNINRSRSKSAITFKELKNKTEEIYEFGNDWGLYVDIEMNYQNNFKPQKIKTSNFTLFKILEDDDEEENEMQNENKNQKYNYFHNTRLFLTKILFYLSLLLGFNYYLDNK